MDMDISMDIHAISVDVDMDMDGKFYIHGNLSIISRNHYYTTYMSLPDAFSYRYLLCYLTLSDLEQTDVGHYKLACNVLV